MRDLGNPSPISVESFLKLGYFIDYDANRQPIDFSRIEKARYAETPRPELLVMGKEALRATLARDFQSSKDHVVPLSGGLDSRLILCALLEHTEAKNIRTYTHGIPGSYDFEIGAQLAKEAGTRHVSFPMSTMTYHEDDLRHVARREDCQAVLFLNTPSREV
jgi:asparagine synthetase B (glutamine-hydrolysing)